MQGKYGTTTKAHLLRHLPAGQHCDGGTSPRNAQHNPRQARACRDNNP